MFHIPLLLLNRLGCGFVPLYCDETGNFARGAEPVEKNLSDLAAAVISSDADVGFAFDPDGDRLAVIDEQGRPLGEERTLVLAALNETA